MKALVIAESWPTPVPYVHGSGPVTWVTLAPDVAAAVSAQCSLGHQAQAPSVTAVPASSPAAMTRPPAPAASPSFPPDRSAALKSPDTRRASVTGGNIRRNHVYLPLDFFPAEAIGGSNKATAAPKAICVTFQPGVTVETGIDGAKRFLRARGPVDDFLARAGVEDGGAVLITRTTPYAYTISEAPHD